MRVPNWIPWFVIGLWFVWLITIVATGLGLDIWSRAFDLQAAASFGDAFGSFGSLTAALAAAGALLTLRQQQEQSTRENFESNFFGLLNHFQGVVQGTYAHSWRSEVNEEGEEEDFLNYTFQGHHAFKAILDELRQSLSISDFGHKHLVSDAYHSFYEKFQDDLGHYFRLLYHLLKIISERCLEDDSQKYYYAQIVRAHLSASELLLLAYNCICGEGREKFVSYLERYSVLHNIGFSSDEFGREEQVFVEKHLSANAFVSRSQAALGGA